VEWFSDGGVNSSRIVEDKRTRRKQSRSHKKNRNVFRRPLAYFAMTYNMLWRRHNRTKSTCLHRKTLLTNSLLRFNNTEFFIYTSDIQPLFFRTKTHTLRRLCIRGNDIFNFCLFNCNNGLKICKMYKCLIDYE